MWMPEIVAAETVAAGEGAPEGDEFDDEKARRDATNNFALLGSTGHVNRLAAAGLQYT
jgi:hypothetical protein